MDGGVPDRSIPYYNIILRCDVFDGAEPALPEGFRFAQFQPGNERDWARLETLMGDFETRTEAEEYFVRTYCADPDELCRRCVLAKDDAGRIVGSCIAWRDPRGEETVGSLHWLVVDPAVQRKGIGRALALRTMQIFAQNGEYPVYIHTQPWSWKAIRLYCDLGFAIQPTDTFSHYENQYGQCPPEITALFDRDGAAAR